jgi:hypothetical protein
MYSKGTRFRRKLQSLQGNDTDSAVYVAIGCRPSGPDSPKTPSIIAHLSVLFPAVAVGFMLERFCAIALQLRIIRVQRRIPHSTAPNPSSTQRLIL